ncbi:MAG: potassium channel protein [Chloroflexi bacterium]|nr:potassium channel protein [Chloroflexota bacterium]
MARQMYRRFIWAGGMLLAISLIGTLGYWLIGGRQYSLLDALYMTFITVATIGYGEIIDLSSSPVGRIFTMLIAISGIGVLAYSMTNLTALIVEGELTDSFRRRAMEKKASKYKDHYIICGIGAVGFHIVNELYDTQRPHVIVDIDRQNIDKTLQVLSAETFIEGDATDGETLLKAGIENAEGLFAVTGDDNENLVITLTAKQLNPKVKVVARCNELRNGEKMKKAGADALVPLNLIGGLRMASEMVRPTVVSFLDTMMRDRKKNLRIEEIRVPDKFVGEPISSLNLKEHPHVLLLAVRVGGDWVYSPSDHWVIGPESTLVFMTTREERQDLERIFKS